MAGKIVNLRLARKKKRRKDAASDVDASAALHGLTREQKSLAKARNEKADRELDSHKLSED